MTGEVGKSHFSGTAYWEGHNSTMTFGAMVFSLSNTTLPQFNQISGRTGLGEALSDDIQLQCVHLASWEAVHLAS